MRKTLNRVLSILLICVMIFTGDASQAFAGEIDLITENAETITEEVELEETCESPTEEILIEDVYDEESCLELMDDETSIIQIEWEGLGIDRKLKYKTDFYYLFYAVFYKKSFADEWTCVKDRERVHTQAKEYGTWVDYLPTLNEMYLDSTIPGSGYVKIRVENGDRSVYAESSSIDVTFDMLDRPTGLAWEGLYFEPYAAWNPVEGADSYTVTVYAPGGITVSTYPVEEYMTNEGEKRCRAALYSQTCATGDYYFTVQAWNADKTKRSFVTELDSSLRKQLYKPVYEIDNMHIGHLLHESCLLKSKSNEYENPDCYYWNKNAQEITYKWNLYEEGKLYSIAQGEINNKEAISGIPTNKRGVSVDIGKYIKKNSTPYYLKIAGFDSKGMSNTKEVETSVFYSWGTSTVTYGKSENGYYPEINLQSGKLDDSGKIIKPSYYYQWQVKENGVWKNIEDGNVRIFNPNEKWGENAIGKTIRVVVGTHDVYDVKYPNIHTSTPHYIGLLCSEELVITEKEAQTVGSDYLQGTLLISCYDTTVEPEVIGKPRLSDSRLKVEYVKATDESGNPVESVDPAKLTYEWYRDDESTPFLTKINTLEGTSYSLKTGDLGHYIYCKVYMTDNSKKGEVVSKKIGPVLKQKSFVSISVDNSKLTETEIPVKIVNNAGSCEMAITEKGTEATFSKKDLVYYDSEDVAMMSSSGSEIISGFKTNTEYTIWVKDSGNQYIDAGTTSVDVTTKNHEPKYRTVGSHEFKVWGYDATSHWNICKNCGEIFGAEKHDHNGIKDTCSVCVYEYNPGEFEVEILGNPYKYTGKAIKPQIKVTAGETVLKEKTDYTVSYKNNTNAGTDTVLPSVIVTGKGNYSGKKTVNFTINPVNIDDMDFTGGPIVSKYNAKKPTVAVNPTVTVNGKKLKKGTDYVIKECSSGSTPKETDVTVNSVTGTANATVSKMLYIEGKGNYSGNSKVFEFAITHKKPLSSIKVKKLPDQTYTGYENIRPFIKDANGEYLFEDGAIWDDPYYTRPYTFNGKDGVKIPGKVVGTVTAPQNSDYYGTLNFEFNVVKPDIGKGYILSNEIQESAEHIVGKVVKKKKIADQVYTGDSISLVDCNDAGYGKVGTDSIKLACLTTVGDITNTEDPLYPKRYYGQKDTYLLAGRDYSIEYINNINVGTAKVILKGKSKYTGTKELTFKIVPYTYDSKATDGDPKFAISDIADQEYNSKGSCPKPTISFNGHPLTEGVDYTLSYKNNKAIGSKDGGKKAPSVTIKFKGNLRGSVTKTFNIKQRNISSIVIPSYVAKYTGKMIIPKFNVVVDGKTLKENKDYEVRSTAMAGNLGRINIGYYAEEYVITAKGNYTGTKGASFIISEIGDVSKLSIDKISDQYYTGKEIKPEIYSKKVKLDPARYTILYSNNTEVGTATVTIKDSNYESGAAGVKTATFKIKSYNFSDFALNGNSKLKGFTFTYGDKSIYETISNLYVTNPKAKADAIDIVKKIEAPKLEAEDTNFILNFDRDSLEQAGIYNVSIEGRSNWNWLKGIKKFKVTTNPFDVTADLKKSSDRKITITAGDSVYSPSGALPVVKVSFKNGYGTTENLIEGRDYTLSYSNNKAVGNRDAKKAPTVTVKFKGNFKGKGTVKYNITKRNFSRSEISVTASDVLLSGKVGDYKTKTITVTDSGKKLTAGKDYKVVSYKYVAGDSLGPNDKGLSDKDVEVTLEGIGNYTGSGTAKYQLGKFNLAKCKGSVKEKVFTPGVSVKLDTSDITIKDPANGNIVLTRGIDYEILEETYSGNKKVGTASVKIRGIGDYTGTLKVSFKIKGKTIN